MRTEWTPEQVSPTDPTKEVSMEEGGLYQIIYKAESGNYRWYMWEVTAVFLERTNDGKVIMSLRPEAGTFDLPAKDILRVDRAVGRTLDRGNDGVKLPKKLGAYNG